MKKVIYTALAIGLSAIALTDSGFAASVCTTPNFLSFTPCSGTDDPVGFVVYKDNTISSTALTAFSTSCSSSSPIPTTSVGNSFATTWGCFDTANNGALTSIEGTVTVGTNALPFNIAMDADATIIRSSYYYYKIYISTSRSLTDGANGAGCWGYTDGTNSHPYPTTGTPLYYYALCWNHR